MRKKSLILLCIAVLMTFFISGCQQANKKPVVPEEKPRTDINRTADLNASEKRVMADHFSNVAENVDGVKKATVVVREADDTINNSANPNNVGRINKDTTYRNDDAQARLDNNKQTNNNMVDNLDKPDYNPLGTNTTTRERDRIVVMVGINLEDNMNTDNNREEDCKRMVKEKIMKSDQRVSDVLVTTDKSMVDKMGDVANGIIEGKPMESFSKDIDELTQDLRGQ